MIELVILDCDGVLFDSLPANIAFYNTVLERIGQPPLTPEWERKAHFLASPQVYDTLFGEGSELAAAARRAAREVSYTPFFDLMVPTPGLYETLADLGARHRLAMATNRGSTLPEIVRRFGLDRHLGLAVGIHDVARPKPAPDMLLECLSHFGVPPEAALYVGDAPTDREAAAAAGIGFIGVGEHTGADDVIPELRDLPGRLLARPQRAVAGLPREVDAHSISPTPSVE